MRQRVAVNAVGGERKPFIAYARCGIYLLDLVVGRRFNGIGFVSAEQLDEQTVKVFGTRADNYLRFFDVDSSVARKVALDRGAQHIAACVRRLVKYYVAIVGEHSAHGFA